MKNVKGCLSVMNTSRSENNVNGVYVHCKKTIMTFFFYPDDLYIDITPPLIPDASLVGHIIYNTIQNTTPEYIIFYKC